MKRAFSLFLVMVLAMTAILPAAYAEDDSFGTGVVQDNVYWNETMKIGCALDESWYFYNEEEILQANGMTVEKLEGQLAEIVKEGGNLIDMIAENQQTGANVNVAFERLSLVNSLVLTEKTYLDATQSMLQQVLSQMGIENVEMTQSSVEFLDGEHQSLSITGSYSGVPVYETLVVMKSGRNMIVITVFTLEEGGVEEVLSCFFNTLG